MFLGPFGRLISSASLAFALLGAIAGCSGGDTHGTGGDGTTGQGGSTTSSQGGSGGSAGAGGTVSEPAWRVVLDNADLDGVVLSVWGSAPDNLYAAGGPLGNMGFESLALHFDGAAWERLAPGGAGTYWWVTGSGPADVWWVGEGGRITHWDGVAFEEHASGVTATLWGVWAASPTDAWAVGGKPGGAPGPDEDIVLRWDGVAWNKEALPGAPLGRALFKIWGTSSDNLYAVGEKGTIWHKKGPDWTLESDGDLTTSRLFTVSGCGADEVYAVGGMTVLRSDGQAFQPVDVSLSNVVNGVACGPAGSAALVGFGGLKQRLEGGQWKDDLAAPPFTDLHAVWSDGAGAFWAVGGDFLSPPSAGKRPGVIARFGVGSVADSLSP